MSTRNEKGKGGNFETRRNPFLAQKGQHIAPELAEVQALGSSIDKLLTCGCALLLGHTRDGGAVVITILDGDDRHRTYCSDARELDSAFKALATIYETP